MNTETILEKTRHQGIATLYSWSTNYDFESSPFTGFLDIIGYSFEEFGEKLVPKIVWDFLGLDALATALHDYTIAPQDCIDLINQLLESEKN